MYKTALVLGGGAVRGLAHIGVLKMFKKWNVTIDLICGTSIGGVIGGLVAAGIDIEEIEDFVLSYPWYRLLDVRIGKRGMMAGKKLHNVFVEFLDQHGLRDVNIEDLPIPFRTVATDLKKGNPYVWERGNLSLALRSTASIPGIFAPVHYEDMVLVDGAMTNNLPADIPKVMGMDLVIAVDVERQHEEREPKHTLDVLYRSYSIMATVLSRQNLQYADLVIQPIVGHVLSLDFPKMRVCIEAGEKAAKESLPQLIHLGLVHPNGLDSHLSYS
ncbi:patatin-like phospholipase family protein [Alicyclobacillus shizuokensis]|uniref:patatin-like phospholipase family protein n=1 Tax=Alicyclobacillus shizuokensis TaxID=392014 RepID=UPI0008315D13|nr:patatin-like phospholipase family protein [Alicyclobacillus shizuokensis]